MRWVRTRVAVGEGDVVEEDGESPVEVVEDLRIAAMRSGTCIEIL